MRRVSASLGLLASIAAATLAHAADKPASPSSTGAFTLTSSTFAPGATLSDAQVFNGFGCTGKNRSPALEWKNPPAGTKSFALTVFDPDAPTGSGWWHWVVFDIAASTTALPAGAGTPDGKLLPPGARQNVTDFGVPGYGGPCPPAGDKAHRYQFKLHALKVEKLDIPPGATAALVGFNLHFNALAVAELTGLYSR